MTSHLFLLSRVYPNTPAYHPLQRSATFAMLSVDRGFAAYIVTPHMYLIAYLCATQQAMQS